MAWCRRAALLDEPIILNSLVGKVVRLLFEGVSARSISKKLSLPYDGVLRVARACRILLKRGRPGRWKGGALKGGLDTKRSAEIERLTEKGYTLAEIGARFGISRERVRQVLLSLGRKSIARDVRWERRMRRLERLSQRGLTLSEAANRLGLARATVVAEARLQGLVFAPERRKRPLLIQG